MNDCRLDNLEWNICDTTDEYDPEVSHRRGVLKPEETKKRMTEAKYKQGQETIRKAAMTRSMALTSTMTAIEQMTRQIEFS